SAIKGTGADGNVLKADLEKAIAEAENAAPKSDDDGAKPAPSQPWAKPSAATAPAAPADSVPSEAHDQHTPTGPSPEQFSELSEDERVEFETFMSEQAQAKLDQLTKGRKARAIAVNLVDGASHYGKRIPQPRRKELEA